MQQIGRYLIEGELGRGAMGIVYRARDTAIGRTVAIKTIRLHDLASPGEHSRLRDRLFREAQSAGILSHPGIVTIYDIAEENGVAYVAMEYVSGQTLDRVVATDPPDGKLVLAILSQTASALDYAHKRGIVHRDIKPANIMIDEGPVAKVTDFGVAKIQSHELTQAGAMVGTPNYMSPEQIQGKVVDGKSDQFSLAVIAYELLTGEKPFSADSIAALAFRIVNEQPPSVHQLNPTLDWPVDTVLRRGLSKRPEERYPSCSDFVFALDNACRACRKWKPLPTGATQTMATVADRTAPIVLPEMKSSPVRRLQNDDTSVPAPLRWVRFIAMLMLGGAAVGALLIGAIQFFEDTPEEPAEPAPTQAVAPQPERVKKPSAMPALPGDPDPNAATQPEPAQEPEPPPAAPRAKATPAKPASGGPTRIVTNPPGAFVVIDGSSSQSCTSPCFVELPPGRHTLAVTLTGYRRALRIFETPSDAEIFLNLDQARGTVMVRSDPEGVTIAVDGQTRAEKTPAVLTLPAGPHTIELIRDGERESHQVIVRESAITNVQVSFR